ncbi:MAG: hypothetical protein ACK58L_14435 [Planctomycetota bacterium]
MSLAGQRRQSLRGIVRFFCAVIPFCVVNLVPWCAFAGTKTWDGRWDTTKIEVSVVYFVPSDRTPLSDWNERVRYFCRRIEQFHHREFQGQSVLKTVIHPEPLLSECTTAELRRGDANAIFFRTLQECDRRLKFAQEQRRSFPILLVLSEINWQPLDDFYRLKPASMSLEFEGQNIGGQHFPGAAAGGARATYLADRGAGWGLVSADGWRVPYRGSDCVVYHEGCGHTVGLPHPEPVDNSVMGVAQYEGWINESFLNKEQKIRLNWEPKETAASLQQELFDSFTAVPDPVVPKPGDHIRLNLTWPKECRVRTLQVRYQTSIDGPWIDAAQAVKDDRPVCADVGRFERASPVSYRVDVELETGEVAELWGYFQVRNDPEKIVVPHVLPRDLMTHSDSRNGRGEFVFDEAGEIDLLGHLDLSKCWSQGEWTLQDDKLVSPKMYGSRLELPFSPTTSYRLIAIVEPLDAPNGLVLGHQIQGHRFVTLFHYANGETPQSAVENVDNQNVGNETTFSGEVFRKGRLSQVIVTVQDGGVTMAVDGRVISEWTGAADRLSLSDYWQTPGRTSLFVGAYDCRYRFHRLTVLPYKPE